MKYYVQSKFYDNGKSTTQIWTESEAHEMDRTNKETKKYDEYWDEFGSYEEAEEFCKQEA